MLKFVHIVVGTEEIFVQCVQIIVNIIAADVAVNMERIGSVVVPEPNPFGNPVHPGGAVPPEGETVLVDGHIVKSGIVVVDDVNFLGRSGHTADFLGKTGGLGESNRRQS